MTHHTPVALFYFYLQLWNDYFFLSGSWKGTKGLFIDFFVSEQEIK